MTSTCLAVLMALAAATIGCELDDPCDPGQQSWRGVCIAIVDAEVPAPDGGTAGDGGAAACAPDFDTSCATGEDCGCDSDFCAIIPGDPEGYCTRTGCLGDPSVCPEGWGCVDLSQYVPGYPQASCDASRRPPGPSGGSPRP